MTLDWTELDAELRCWEQQGLSLPLWWRDDDAVAQTPALVRLHEMARTFDLPVHLAIIPARIEDSLVQYLQGSTHLLPIVHGWSHENHAPEGQKKSEFGPTRPVELALRDAEAGADALRPLFGKALRPMFAPPWNRISAGLLPWLAGLGYGAVSTYGARPSDVAAPGLRQINTHIDPIAWKSGGGRVPGPALIARTTGLLRDRREGRADAEEPFGLLTHHLVQDEETWDFCEAFLERLLNGPGRSWQFHERMI